VNALRDIDRVLAWVAWIAAGLLVLMLFVGPKIIAEDQPGAQGTQTYSADDGQQLFVDNCADCHTLTAAGASGSVGPSLDGTGLTTDQVRSIVGSGSGAMPSFSGTLNQGQIDAIAAYVSSASD
jgi:mono/diheme cytochrome c family protein